MDRSMRQSCSRARVRTVARAIAPARARSSRVQNRRSRVFVFAVERRRRARGRHRHARLDSARLHEGVPDDVRRAIDRLIDSGRVDGGIENAVRGDGTWRVFSAPHISRLATPLGVKFHPLRYVIADGT